MGYNYEGHHRNVDRDAFSFLRPHVQNRDRTMGTLGPRHGHMEPLQHNWPVRCAYISNGCTESHSHPHLASCVGSFHPVEDQ